MHDLIQRYIAETVRHLKSSERNEVEKELTANILDMAGENPSDKDVENTLLSMGSPVALASKYRGKERYLIGPASFDMYLMILKLVALIVSLVTMVFTILSFFLNTSDLNIFEMIAKTIGEVFSAASSVFLWVTVTFALLDYHQVNTQHDEWNLSALRSLEAVSTKVIKKSEVIADLIGISIFIIFLGFLYSRSDLLAIYQNDAMPIPMVIASELRPYLVGWMIVSLLSFVMAVLKLVKMIWSAPLFAFSAAFDLLGLFYFIFVITRWNMYTPGFLDFFNLTIDRWQTIIKMSSAVLLILTLIGIASDAYATFWKKSHDGGAIL